MPSSGFLGHCIYMVDIHADPNTHIEKIEITIRQRTIKTSASTSELYACSMYL